MWLWVEKISFWLGLLLLSIFALSRWHAHWGYQQAMAQFEQNVPTIPDTGVQLLSPSEPTAPPDGFPSAPEPALAPELPSSVQTDTAPLDTPTQTLPQSEPEPLYLEQPIATLDADSAPVRPEASRWSESRRASYQRAAASYDVPVAMLAIPAIDLVVPVFNGVMERQLNKGVGWVDNGSALDGSGNLALAGHRDGFFRRLGELKAGDPLWVTDAQGQRHRFEVQRHLIVEPQDVWVLEPEAEAELTLITCYPFYFLGSAPQRYVVKATRTEIPGPH
ncbi:class D sortase [Ferrimonas balearica]|uniref:class D sortase n=1 Tax=Ferrimonas balearica TaxID=44012 RepID=UPI001C98EA70|nr:class D sortase [Ferrimonas balearica]MBY5920150.1 sortase [Ferrimonas balearica]MBY5997165.1 sortase [Ferrimonas balearica]